MNQLTFEIDNEGLDLPVNELEKVFETNKAVWHKNCRNKVDDQKVLRAR